MFAVIDCGTTTTRIYLVNEKKEIVSSGYARVGVRDTSITGSKDALRNGLMTLFFKTVKEAGVQAQDVQFAVASGMITSEIGLIELPHVVAPAGKKDLVDSVVKVGDSSEILPLGCPVYFIRGIKNPETQQVNGRTLKYVDFMRGEEVQVIGAMELYNIDYPFNIVALSSHTKIMFVGEDRLIHTSRTSISGQIFDAICHSTSIASSLMPEGNDEPVNYSENELIAMATDCVETGGFVRTCMMPRFQQVFTDATSADRRYFLDAAIAADELKIFREMRESGYRSDVYLLYGHEIRCKLYEKILQREFGDKIRCIKVYNKEELERLTVTGSVSVAFDSMNQSE